MRQPKAPLESLRGGQGGAVLGAILRLLLAEQAAAEEAASMDGQSPLPQPTTIQGEGGGGGVAAPLGCAGVVSVARD